MDGSIYSAEHRLRAKILLHNGFLNALSFPDVVPIKIKLALRQISSARKYSLS